MLLFFVKGNGKYKLASQVVFCKPEGEREREGKERREKKKRENEYENHH